MGKLKIFGGLLTSGAIITGVSATWQRHEAFVHRQGELLKERKELQAQLGQLNKQIEAEELVHQEKMKKLVHRRRTIDALWTERKRRYVDAIDQQEGFLSQVPLALSIMQGLRNHYNYMGNTMPEFFAFDHGASKLHDLALLMSMVRRPLTSPVVVEGTTGSSGAGNTKASHPFDLETETPTIAKVVDEIEFMFHGESVVASICLGLRLNAALREEPQSLGELSAAFTTGLTNLHSVAELAAVKKAEEEKKEEAQETEEISKNLMQRIGHICLKQLYVDESPYNPASEKPAEPSVQKYRKSRTLHSDSDVSAAIKYVDQLLSRVQQIPLLKESTDVKAAASALKSWQRAATSYLVHQQAHEALISFNRVLEYSFIDPNAGERTEKAPQ